MSEVGCPAEKARKIQDLEDLGILWQERSHVSGLRRWSPNSIRLRVSWNCVQHFLFLEDSDRGV